MDDYPSSMANLLREEARARASIVGSPRISVELDVRDPDRFRLRTSIDFQACAGQSTFLDIEPLDVASAELNGRPLRSWADGRLPLDRLADHNQVVVEAVMAYSSDGEGLHQHIDPLDGRRYLYAMSFLDAAPRWLACFDQPDIKGRYRFDVHTPANWLVRGSGPATRISPDHWLVDWTLPLPSYLVTLCAGPWASLTERHDGIRLGFHARQSLAEILHAEAGELLAVTRSSFDEYHRLFGVRYPFGDYEQFFVPDFNVGAMENPGCVTLRDQFLFRGAATAAQRAGRAGVIAHEMAHQWFGDLVTLRWWDDLWLSESFAEYLGHRVCSTATDYRLWTGFSVRRKDWGAIADQGPSTHPVAANGAEDAGQALTNFDGISYAKGASVLRQLVATIGDECFLEGLRRYFHQFAFGNAELADLVACWQAVGATDLDDWVDQWVHTSGMDRLTGLRTPQGWAIDRSVPMDDPSRRVHVVNAALLDAQGHECQRSRVVINSDRTPLALQPGSGVLVPDADDLTWAVVRCSEGWRALPIGRIPHPLTRAVLYNGIRDAVRAGELASGQAIDLLLAAMVDEPDEEMLAAVLDSTIEFAGLWTPPGLRMERWDQIATLTETLLDAAPPASDRQLVTLRAFIKVTRQVDLLDDWLRGHRLPAGRQLDPELRWAIVTRLMLLGADPALVDAELSLDPSATGRDAAAGARAASPDPARKWAAFERLLGGQDVRVYELYAIADQLFHPLHDQVCRPLVQPWFDGINDLASSRRGWALGELVARSFPASPVEARTLAAARQTLGNPQLHPVVRRALIDGVDRLERQLRALGPAAQAMGRSSDGQPERL